MNSALQIPALNFKMFPLWMFYYSILYAFLYFPNFLHEILSVFHNQEKHFLKCSFHCPAWGKKKKKSMMKNNTRLPLITQILSKYHFLALVFANSRKQKPNPMNVCIQFFCLPTSYQFINLSTGSFNLCWES